MIAYATLDNTGQSETMSVNAKTNIEAREAIPNGFSISSLRVFIGFP